MIHRLVAISQILIVRSLDPETIRWPALKNFAVVTLSEWPVNANCIWWDSILKTDLKMKIVKIKF
jgi:hypothetical protein